MFYGQCCKCNQRWELGTASTCNCPDEAPKREWQGLTQDELKPICDEYRILFGYWVNDFARVIEAKLKEKNT